MKESLLEEGLLKRDVETIVEHYPAPEGEPDGYEIEFFAASGNTITLVSLSETLLRTSTKADRLAVRLDTTSK